MRNIIIAVLALVLIGGGIGFYLFNKKTPSTQDLKADFTVKMEDFYGEFEKDEKAAFEKYKDKVVEVTGKVTEKGGADAQHVDITLGSDATTGTVSVSLEPNQADKAGNIKAGDAITVKGVCTGIQSSNSDSSSGETSMLDDLGKEVQMKKGILVVKN